MFDTFIFITSTVVWFNFLSQKALNDVKKVKKNILFTYQPIVPSPAT